MYAIFKKNVNLLIKVKWQIGDHFWALSNVKNPHRAKAIV